MRAPPHRNPDFEKGRGRWLPSWWRPPAAGAPVAPSQSSWSSSGPASVCRGGAAAPPALIIPFVVRQDPPRRQMPPSTGQAADDRPLAGEKGVLRILLPNRVCCELERQRCQRRGATERGAGVGGRRRHHPQGGGTTQWAVSALSPFGCGARFAGPGTSGSTGFAGAVASSHGIGRSYCPTRKIIRNSPH